MRVLSHKTVSLYFCSLVALSRLQLFRSALLISHLPHCFYRCVPVTQLFMTLPMPLLICWACSQYVCSSLTMSLDFEMPLIHPAK